MDWHTSGGGLLSLLPGRCLLHVALLGIDLGAILDLDSRLPQRHEMGCIHLSPMILSSHGQFAGHGQAGVVVPTKITHSLVTNLIRHKVPPTKIMAVTRHRPLDTLLDYAHEVDRAEDPAETYVNYRNGA